jgi:GNAT superfamily N-acetyltransferase
MTALPPPVLRRPNPVRFAADVEAATALFIASRRAAMPWLRSVHTDAETAVWMRETVFPHHSVWLAEVGGEIVGLATRDGAWLANLYVKPGRTSQGIGSALLGKVIAEAAMITPVLRVFTFARNDGARCFYERHGFTLTAQGDGSGNEEREPDVRYERPTRR